MEKLEICEQCKGICCKNSPGNYSAKQYFSLSEEAKKDVTLVYELFVNPDIMTGGSDIMDMEMLTEAIVEWKRFGRIVKGEDSDVKVLIMARPKSVDDNIGIMSKRSLGGGAMCSKLTDTGCSLSHEERPQECQALVPNKVDDKFICEVPDRDDIRYTWVDDDIQDKMSELILEKLSDIFKMYKHPKSYQPNFEYGTKFIESQLKACNNLNINRLEEVRDFIDTALEIDYRGCRELLRVKC